MRYIEQLRYSWGYHRGIVWKCLIMLVGELRWWIVGLLVVVCVVPLMIYSLTLIMGDYFIVREQPSFLLALNYYWVTGSGFKLLAKVLSLASIGVLLVACLREK